MTSSWMKRNGVFLALLLPALALALALSSWRMLNLHLPMSWSRPIVAQGSTGVYEQDFLGFDGKTHHRRVEVEVRELEQVHTYEGSRAADGANLWRVELRLTAPPGELLDDECTLELVDADGTRYAMRNSQVQADDDPLYAPVFLFSCVPDDAPGPSFDPFTGEVTDSGTQRPPSWDIEGAIAVPEGVTPAWVRLAWAMPEHLLLPAPAH